MPLGTFTRFLQACWPYFIEAFLKLECTLEINRKYAGWKIDLQDKEYIIFLAIFTQFHIFNPQFF